MVIDELGVELKHVKKQRILFLKDKHAQEIRLFLNLQLSTDINNLTHIITAFLMIIQKPDS